MQIYALAIVLAGFFAGCSPQPKAPPPRDEAEVAERGLRPGQTAGCDPKLIDRLLQVIEEDIVPLTRQEVARGNKVFGAAILRKADLSLVVAASNNEIENPLWHGEVHAIKLLWEKPRAERPPPKSCLFLATHEPCPLCLSAITWGGYDNFYYLYSHEDSRDSFNIGHDLKLLKEVFKQDPGEYARSNAYWTGYSIRDLVDNCDADARRRFLERIEALGRAYAEMSETYQLEKERSDIPLK